jgi:hypothetical protein
MWTFKDENVLREPKGIALDQNKNVYVSGYKTNPTCMANIYRVCNGVGNHV